MWSSKDKHRNRIPQLRRQKRPWHFWFHSGDVGCQVNINFASAEHTDINLGASLIHGLGDYTGRVLVFLTPHRYPQYLTALQHGSLLRSCVTCRKNTCFLYIGVAQKKYTVLLEPWAIIAFWIWILNLFHWTVSAKYRDGELPMKNLFMKSIGFNQRTI